MKKLSKQQLAEKEQHKTDIDAAKAALDKAVEEYNEAIDREYMKVEAAINNYNGVAESFNQWREQIRSDQENYQSERSEKWQEGDSGQAYQEWMDAWGEEVEELQVTEPDKLEINIDVTGESIEQQYTDEVGS